jgi:hypothetical protein
MVFIGYFEGTKVYMLLDSGTEHIHTPRNAIFDKNRGWKWTSGVSVDEAAWTMGP